MFAVQDIPISYEWTAQSVRETSYTHLPCVRSTGYTNLVRMDGSKRTRDSSNTSRNGSKRTRNSSKRTRNSSNSSTKQQKAVRNFEPTNIMGGTNISEGVQRFQVVSEIFVPGGPDISGVQIFRDNPYYYLRAYFPDTRCFCLSWTCKAIPSLINAHLV